MVQPTGAIALGAIASLLCYGAILLKNRVGYDDCLDAFGIHGVAGMAGALLLTFFIRAGEIPMDRRGVVEQFGVQALGVATTIGFCAVVTLSCWSSSTRRSVSGSAPRRDGGHGPQLHGEQGYGLLNLN